MASLATDQAESIDVIKTEDLFFELLESVAVTHTYTLNTEFENLSSLLKEDIDNLFIKKEGPSGKTKRYEPVELIMIRLLKHMEEINDYSFIITEIKDKIKKSGEYSFEELKDSNEMQMYRETLQNFIKKYIEALIKSEENLSQSSRQSETQGQGATGAYVATPRPTFNQNKRNIRRNLIDEFNAESDKKNTNKKRKRGGKKRRNNKKSKKRKSKKRKSKRRKSRKHKTKRKR